MDDELPRALKDLSRALSAASVATMTLAAILAKRVERGELPDATGAGVKPPMTGNLGTQVQRARDRARSTAPGGKP